MIPPLKPPSANQLEISIFGKGSGESILVHLGDGRWIIIDSLKVKKRPIALAYLDEIGVEVATAVELVVATHWHDDHIHGLAKIYELATSAHLSFPAAMLRDEFQRFAETFGVVPASKMTSGVREFGLICTEANRRGWARVQPASAWTTLLRHPKGRLSHGNQAVIQAMSPSPFDMIEFLGCVAGTVFPSNVAIRAPHFDRNDVSCALHIDLGATSLLFGADLENVADVRSGWKAVLASQQLPGRTGIFFKIAHHGSETGHNDEIWTKLCVDKPIATLSTWARGGKRLPKRSDAERVIALTSESYSTSQTPTSGKSHRLHAVNSVLRRSGSSIRNLDTRLGHVRHRLYLDDPSAKWETQLFGAACLLNLVA